MHRGDIRSNGARREARDIPSNSLTYNQRQHEFIIDFAKSARRCLLFHHIRSRESHTCVWSESVVHTLHPFVEPAPLDQIFRESNEA